MMDGETIRKLSIRFTHAAVGRGNRFRTLFLLLLACSWKNLPLIWHYRFFNAFLQHGLRPRPIPHAASTDDAYPLFLPVITSTSSPILECDYNIHKSNSTYFSDLDIARTHLISLLCAPGIAGYRKRVAAGEESGQLNIALGGVACFFQKEIKPYERYEMWTRLLSWDKKWVYTVTHFVKKGTVAPTEYLMQPKGQSWWPEWMNKSNVKAQKSLKPKKTQDLPEKKQIFAFALSKYVFKSHRKTIPPETVFGNCGLLPARPANSTTPEPSSAVNFGLVQNPVIVGPALSAEPVDDLLVSSLGPSQVGAQEWTWELVEKERQRGMKIAEHMAGLDELKEEFTGDTKPALGVYRDLLWA